MATYKFNALQRFGKFHGDLFSVTDPAGDPLKNPGHDSAAALSAFLQDQIEKLGLDEDGDAVIFRNNSYSDFADLDRAVRMATY